MTEAPWSFNILLNAKYKNIEKLDNLVEFCNYKCDRDKEAKSMVFFRLVQYFVHLFWQAVVFYELI